MAERTILVTGATGRTGPMVVKELQARHLKPRAMVRRDDERAEKLRALGAETVVGNLHDLDATRAALEGVDGAFFLYPIRDGLAHATAFFAQAAAEAGTRFIVNMSQKPARREAKSHASRDHWVSERVFDWSPTPTAHIRPTFFADWYIYPRHRQMIDAGVLQLPFGEGRHAPIAAEDQARFIAALMAEPADHGGKVYPLHGPRQMDGHGIAREIGAGLGREVRYEAVSWDVYKGFLHGAPSMTDHTVQHLEQVALDYQDGVFEGEDDIIGRLTGTPPLTVRGYIERHRDLFDRAG